MNQEIDTMTRSTCSRFLLLPLLLALVACGSRMSAEERLDLARSQLAEGDVPTASIHLRNVLQADPTNVEARILLAQAAFRYGDFDSAAKEYQRAVDLGADPEDFRAALVESLVRAGGAQDALRYTDPEVVGDDPELAYWRAIALARAGRADEGVALLESLRDVPEWGDRAQVALARVALGNQRPEAALAMLEPLEARMAGDPDFWEVRGFAALQAGRTDLAVEAFDKALAVVVDPLGQRQFMFQSGKAEALLAAGKVDEARAVAAALHGAADRHPVANYLMSRVELQSGNADQALAYAQAVLAAQPDSSLGNMMAGAANLALGQTAPAERYLEQAIANDPTNLPARKLLAQTRLGLRSPERALEALQPAMGDGADPAVAALAGMASVQAGDPDAAVDIFRRQLEQEPGNEDVRAMLAVSLMSAGRTEEALAELAKVETGEAVTRQRADLIGIAAHLQAGNLLAARSLAGEVAAAAPGDVALYGSLGALFQEAGQLDEAAAWFEEALAMAPDNTAAAYNLGRIEANQGRLDQATQRFNGILAREPDNALVLTALAQLDWARGERDSAVERLQRARAADPADGASRFVLTQYLVAMNRAADAVEVAREAVAIAPDAAPTVNALGVSLLEAGQPADALEQFRRAQQINPAEARYLLNASRAHAALGALEPAREQLVNALALEPENVIMLAALVDLERRAGRFDAAGQALVRLQRAAPRGDPRIVLLGGEVLLGQQRFAEAQEAFQEALRLGMGSRAAIGLFETRRRGGLADPAAPLISWLEEAPDDLGARALLAEHYLAVGDHAAAITEYEKLIASAPDNPMVLNNLAWLYGEAGNPRAVELARRARELAPDNPMIADTLGWILHQRGDNAEALELLAGAVAAAPQAGDVRYRYAEVLAATGDTAGAIREARLVLADTGAANYHEPAQKLLNRLEQD
jgi:putative PEP-CTERM system TPR-repeat lipoprotein